jgi:hypothetical protein
MFKKTKGVTSAQSRPGPIGNDAPQALAGAEADLRYDEPESDANLVGSTEDTARYIADMVGALAAMAGEARLDLLTYLLNMARVEAELQSRQSEDGDSADD